MRLLWIIWVTICCLQFCDRHPDAWSETPKAPTTVSVLYEVQEGDTLSSIADKHGLTWRQLWEMNEDSIQDPNIIYPKQTLVIGAKTIIKKPLTRAERVNKIARLMHERAVIPYRDKMSLQADIPVYHYNLKTAGLSRLPLQRTTLTQLYTATRQYEIWLLAEAIEKQAKDNDEIYRLVGLAWQETHFVNKRGKKGEVGFFQFLPSTVKWWFKASDQDLPGLLIELENSPSFAVQTALDMLTKNKWDWAWWNHGLTYKYHVNNKIYKVKQELNF